MRESRANFGRMNFAILNRCFLAVGLCLLALSFECEALAEDNLPSASSVIQRMLRRSDQVSRSGEASKYTYEKRSLAEELDNNTGKPTKSTQQIYQVTPIQGIPFSRLIRVQDRELTQDEVKSQDGKEQEFRRRLAEGNHRATNKRGKDILNEKLLERYDFKVEKRERLDNRPVIVVSFRPKKPHLLEQSVEDKVLNRLAGKVWIEEAEAEVVKVRAGLTEDLSLGWFGMIGSIKRCDFEIERQRLPDGVWVDKSFVVSLAGRKVFSPMRYHSLEESYNFRKL
jgi:hypothetical protein